MNQRLSLARAVVGVSLGIQILHLLRVIFLISGFNQYFAGLIKGDGQSVGITIPLLLLLIALVPAWQGRRWALIISPALCLSVLIGGGRFFFADLTAPIDNWLMWAWGLIAFSGQILGMVYGIIAVLESFGRTKPAGWKGLQGSVVRGVAWVVAGMMILGLAIAFTPSNRGALAKVPDALAKTPDALLMISIENGHFTPDRLNVPAGKVTAVLLVNHDVGPHSFDVDALNIHVAVPGGGVAVAELRAPAAGDVEFTCSVPGHKVGGMVGIVHVQ